MTHHRRWLAFVVLIPLVFTAPGPAEAGPYDGSYGGAGFSRPVDGSYVGAGFSRPGDGSSVGAGFSRPVDGSSVGAGFSRPSDGIAPMQVAASAVVNGSVKDETGGVVAGAYVMLTDQRNRKLRSV